jgi:cation:H+ antiporter
MTLGLLLVSLLIILLGAEAFTNALEHLGQRLKISEGVTGSIFAAVGTALPETMVPIVAVVGNQEGSEVGHEVGVGAILGAPLMLSTLTFFLMAIFAGTKRGWRGILQPELTGLKRDLNWFLVAFSIAAIAIFVPHEGRIARAFMALLLVLTYLVYIMLTIRASARLVAHGHGTKADHPLYLRRVGLPENMPIIVLQLFIGFAFIIVGADGFVHGVESLSEWIGLSVLVLSLLIIPVATELPEKVNSILWIRRGRDTLAFGNITGAMVFQGSLLPAIGIMLTPWEPRPEVSAGIVVTLVAAVWLRLALLQGGLKVWHLAANGLLYMFYLAVVLT